MKAPCFVCPLTDDERDTVTTDLRSSDAFTLLRCQIVLASARRARRRDRAAGGL